MNETHYPLGDDPDGQLKAASGRPLDQINLEALVAGQLGPNDLSISAEALRAQAVFAEQAGYPQLAANLRRAAELTAVPNGELLRMYELLRPGRSTYKELCELAELLEARYTAAATAAFVREAAEAYRARNLVSKP
jgi:propanediol dehydratase small subunit